MVDKSFNEILTNIKEDITKTQLEIMINANINLVNLYYRLGKILYDNSSWGNKFIDNVAVELKNSEFIPEYGSKLGFYLTALDEKVKDENDNPSIGILLFQSKNNEIVDYTLKYINKPVGVSEYKIFNELTSNILNELPKEEDIIIHFEEEN